MTKDKIIQHIDVLQNYVAKVHGLHNVNIEELECGDTTVNFEFTHNRQTDTLATREEDGKIEVWGYEDDKNAPLNFSIKKLKQ